MPNDQDETKEIIARNERAHAAMRALLDARDAIDAAFNALAELGNADLERIDLSDSRARYRERAL